MYKIFLHQYLSHVTWFWLWGLNTDVLWIQRIEISAISSTNMYAGVNLQKAKNRTPSLETDINSCYVSDCCSCCHAHRKNLYPTNLKNLMKLTEQLGALFRLPLSLSFRADLKYKYVTNKPLKPENSISLEIMTLRSRRPASIHLSCKVKINKVIERTALLTRELKDCVR